MQEPVPQVNYTVGSKPAFSFMSHVIAEGEDAKLIFLWFGFIPSNDLIGSKNPLGQPSVRTVTVRDPLGTRQDSTKRFQRSLGLLEFGSVRCRDPP